MRSCAAAVSDCEVEVKHIELCGSSAPPEYKLSTLCVCVISSSPTASLGLVILFTVHEWRPPPLHCFALMRAGEWGRGRGCADALALYHSRCPWDATATVLATSTCAGGQCID